MFNKFNFVLILFFLSGCVSTSVDESMVIDSSYESIDISTCAGVGCNVVIENDLLKIEDSSYGFTKRSLNGFQLFDSKSGKLISNSVSFYEDNPDFTANKFSSISIYPFFSSDVIFDNVIFVDKSSNVGKIEGLSGASSSVFLSKELHKALIKNEISQGVVKYFNGKAYAMFRGRGIGFWTHTKNKELYILETFEWETPNLVTAILFSSAAEHSSRPRLMNMWVRDDGNIYTAYTELSVNHVYNSKLKITFNGIKEFTKDGVEVGPVNVPDDVVAVESSFLNGNFIFVHYKSNGVVLQKSGFSMYDARTGQQKNIENQKHLLGLFKGDFLYFDRKSMTLFSKKVPE